ACSAFPWSSRYLIRFYCCYWSRDLPALHSFPTRRSSDLDGGELVAVQHGVDGDLAAGGQRVAGLLGQGDDEPFVDRADRGVAADGGGGPGCHRALPQISVPGSVGVIIPVSRSIQARASS